MFKEYINKIVTVTMDRKMGDKHLNSKKSGLRVLLVEGGLKAHK